MKADTLALAIDLGGSGGKLFVGSYENGALNMTPVHKFEYNIINLRGRSYWDFLHIFDEIKQGYAKAQRQFDGHIKSIGIDSWCNDFALLTKSGTMLESPRHYRDRRTEGWIERADQLMPKMEVYKRTGQQFARFETCYHLLAMKEQDGDILSLAKDLLFVPDFLSYLLGAKQYTEYTIASVTNLFNIVKREWDEEILQAYGLRKELFMPVVPPGTKVGRVCKEICDELKVPSADIFTVGAHDTASAVAAAPVVQDEPFVFISSGTWSLVGAEIKEPILSQQSMRAGFGNEGGVCDRIRYIRNVMGLWVLQECVRIWERQGKQYEFAQLADMAEKAECYTSFIDPDKECFFEPKDMPKTIAEQCVKNGYTPRNDAEIVRIVTQSLACKYRYVIEKIEKLTDRRYSHVYIFGGGSQNRFLNQLTADFTGKIVVAGPADATAIGNVSMQWIGRGVLKDIVEARAKCKESCSIEVFYPKDTEVANSRYQFFLKSME